MANNNLNRLMRNLPGQLPSHQPTGAPAKPWPTGVNQNDALRKRLRNELPKGNRYFGVIKV